MGGEIRKLKQICAEEGARYHYIVNTNIEHINTETQRMKQWMFSSDIMSFKWRLSQHEGFGCFLKTTTKTREMFLTSHSQVFLTCLCGFVSRLQLKDFFQTLVTPSLVIYAGWSTNYLTSLSDIGSIIVSPCLHLTIKLTHSSCLGFACFSFSWCLIIIWYDVETGVKILKLEFVQDLDGDICYAKCIDKKKAGLRCAFGNVYL